MTRRYGGPEVLYLAEVPIPEPREDQVRIRIRASAVTQSDIFIRSSKVPYYMWLPLRLAIGLIRPRQPVLGLVFAGEIESAGAKTSRFKSGDKVYGLTGFEFGCYAQYKCLRDVDSTRGCISIMPANLSFTDATTAAYGGLLALQYLEKGEIEKRKRVLIYGASGTTGTTAVQIAKSHGAEVTAVCRTENFDLVKSLGAHQCIDYTITDNLPDGAQYDLVMDAVGKMKSSQLKIKCKKALSPGGVYVSIDDGALKLESARLDRIRQLVEEGHVRPHTEKVFPMNEIVEAHRYVEKGHKKGGVAIEIP